MPQAFDSSECRTRVVVGLARLDTRYRWQIPVDGLPVLEYSTVAAESLRMAWDSRYACVRTRVLYSMHE